MSDTGSTTSSLVSRLEKLYELEMAKDLDAWSELWSDDCVVSFPHDADRPANDVHGKETLVAATRQKFIDREKIDLTVRLEPMASGRRVVSHIDVRLTLAGGVKVRGPLLTIATFDESDRISAVEEYYNPASFVPDED